MQQQHGEGQDQASLQSNTSELGVGNEELGQASSSSTTTVADDNDTVDDALHNDANLHSTAHDTYDTSYDIANISPSEDVDSNNESNYEPGEVTINRPNESTTEGGGGGDWFGNARINPHDGPTFKDFVFHFLIAGVIALGTFVVCEVLDGIFKGPRLKALNPKGHRKRRRRF